LKAFQVIVYDFKQDKSWQIKHSFFDPDPSAREYDSAGVQFQWDDGVFGMALGNPVNKAGDRTVYFHAISSTKQFSVPNTGSLKIFLTSLCRSFNFFQY
jgi:hypothetical protein